jgi:hypothetical protein
MKKSLLTLLLVAALVLPVVPAFAADEGSMELEIKAGLTLMPKIAGEDDTSDVESAFLAEVDFFYYVMPELAIGAGINNIFNAKIKGDNAGGTKVGFTNIYAQAKYVFETGNDIFNNVYPLIQLGYGIGSVDSDWVEVDSNGICWGIGVGTTIKENFIFELVYFQDKGKQKFKGWADSAGDVTYSALAVKVGYKFNF